MKQSLEKLMTLTKASIHTEEIRGEIREKKTDLQLTIEELEEIYQYAVRNKLLAILCNQVAMYQELADTEIVKKWKSQARAAVIRQYGVYNALRKVLASAREKNITMILFKGCVLADLYPQYSMRTSSDTDIYVYPKDREKSRALLEELGYQEMKDHSKPMVPVFYHRESRHVIELHYCLWEDYEGSQMELLEELQLDSQESLITLNVCGGMEVTTLGLEEHLIYQIFHVVKHFVLQGIGVRYITDLTLYINKYGSMISWESFWRKIKKLGYETFCIGLFTLGIEYFAMDAACMQGRRCLPESVAEELLVDLLNKGKIMEEKEAGWQILGIMTPYLEGKKKYEESSWKRNFKVMFPEREALSEDYAYAKKHKILLLAAWIHRGVKFAMKRLTQRKQWYSMGEKLDIVNHRLRLMRELELVTTKKEKPPEPLTDKSVIKTK